jgi:hypothetical protein
MEFYLGAHRPRWIDDSRVPLFLTAHGLARYVETENRSETFPRAGVHYAIDSGAFTALDADHTNNAWWRDADEYGGMMYRFIDDCGQPDFVAPQDWPCEPTLRERHGTTVEQHQAWTLENFLYLREEFPHAPWIPVLQAWGPSGYLRHAEMYEAAGVDLAAYRRVGIGSICKRADDGEIVAIVEMLAARGYRLHGFGVKVSGLRRIGHLLTSADSMAWSTAARKRHIRLAGCTHGGEDCRNCFRWAQQWRADEVLPALDGDRQLALDIWAA